jgi:hypothetical protein
MASKKALQRAGVYCRHCMVRVNVQRCLLEGIEWGFVNTDGTVHNCEGVANGQEVGRLERERIREAITKFNKRKGEKR